MKKENFPKELLSYLSEDQLTNLITTNFEFTIPEPIANHFTESGNLESFKRNTVISKKCEQLFKIFEERPIQEKIEVEGHWELQKYKNLVKFIHEYCNRSEIVKCSLILDAVLWSCFDCVGMIDTTMLNNSIADPMENPLIGKFDNINTYVNVYESRTHTLQILSITESGTKSVDSFLIANLPLENKDYIDGYGYGPKPINWKTF
jgi:hypothetical protein